MPTVHFHSLSSYVESMSIYYADSGYYYGDKCVRELYVEGSNLEIKDYINFFTRTMCQLGLAS